MNTRSQEYNDYLKSSHWQSVRKLALTEYNNKCSMCGRTDHLQVHHKHYKTFGHEKTEDVQVVCKDCHEKVLHKNSDHTCKCGESGYLLNVKVQGKGIHIEKRCAKCNYYIRRVARDHINMKLAINKTVIFY